MKKPDHKGQDCVRISTALREVRLHALIFGGAASPTTLLTSDNPRNPKLPLALGE